MYVALAEDPTETQSSKNYSYFWTSPILISTVLRVLRFELRRLPLDRPNDGTS